MTLQPMADPAAAAKYTSTDARGRWATAAAASRVMSDFQPNEGELKKNKTNELSLSKLFFSTPLTGVIIRYPPAAPCGERAAVMSGRWVTTPRAPLVRPSSTEG